MNVHTPNRTLEQPTIASLPHLLRRMAAGGERVHPVELVDLAAALEGGGRARLSLAGAARAAKVSVPTVRRVRQTYDRRGVLRYRPGGAAGGHQPSEVAIVGWEGISRSEIPNARAGFSGLSGGDQSVAGQERAATEGAAAAAPDRSEAQTAPMAAAVGLERGRTSGPGTPGAGSDPVAPSLDPADPVGAADDPPATEQPRRAPGAAAGERSAEADTDAERAAGHDHRSAWAASDEDRAAAFAEAEGAAAVAPGDAVNVPADELRVAAARLRIAIRESGRVGRRPVARVAEIAEGLALLARWVGGIDLAWRYVQAAIAPRMAPHPDVAGERRRMPSYGTLFGCDPVRAVCAVWWRVGVRDGWNGTAPVDLQPGYVPARPTGGTMLDARLQAAVDANEDWTETLDDLVRDELDLEELEHDQEPGAALLLLLHHGIALPAPLRPLLEPLGPPSRTIARWRLQARRGQDRPIRLLQEIDAHARPFIAKLRLWPSQVAADRAVEAAAADGRGFGAPVAAGGSGDDLRASTSSSASAASSRAADAERAADAPPDAPEGAPASTMPERPTEDDLLPEEVAALPPRWEVGTCAPDLRSTVVAWRVSPWRIVVPGWWVGQGLDVAIRDALDDPRWIVEDGAPEPVEDVGPSEERGWSIEAVADDLAARTLSSAARWRNMLDQVASAVRSSTGVDEVDAELAAVAFAVAALNQGHRRRPGGFAWLDVASRRPGELLRPSAWRGIALGWGIRPRERMPTELATLLLRTEPPGRR